MSRFSLFDLVAGIFGTILVAMLLATVGVSCFNLCHALLEGLGQ